MKTKRLIFTLITFLWIGVIFSFSLQPAEVSGEISPGFGRWLMETVFPWLAKKLDSMNAEQLAQFHFLIRKCAHFTEFLVLGIWVTLTLLQTKWNPKWRIGLLFCMGIASIDETIQLFVDGRAGRIADVLLDSTGAATGIGFLFICLFFRNKRKRSSETMH